MKILFALVLSACLVVPSARASEQSFGNVTNLPLPRYVSIKTGEANARRGPSTSHRIDWVFQRRHLPVQVTAEYGHWRRVQDQEGAGGWIHYALLSGVRYVTVTADDTAFYILPNETSEVLARAEEGVVARLGRCLPDWCRVRIDRHRGWVHKSALWGVGRNELRD